MVKRDGKEEKERYTHLNAEFQRIARRDKKASLRDQCKEIKESNRILKEELPWSVGAQYATGDQSRNNSRKHEGMEPKQKQYPVVD